MRNALKHVLMDFLEMEFVDNYNPQTMLEEVDLDQLSDVLVEGLYDNFGDLFDRAHELIEEE